MSETKNIRPRMDERDYALWQEFKAMHPERFENQGKQYFKEAGRHLLMGCSHVPFHNKAMLNSVLNLLEDQLFVGLHLMGDFLDMNTFSSHDKGKFTAIKDLTYNQELNAGNKVLDQIMDAAGNSLIDMSYLYGNHEDRYWRYMKDMENAKRPHISPAEGLQLEDRGFSVFDNWQKDYVKLGDHLELIHGTYFNVHCAKKHIDTLRGSVAFVHTHRIQHYIEGRTGGYNIGWGGDVESPAFNYASRAMKGQWQNGLAVVTLDEFGNYYLEQLTFINNRFVYGGIIY